MPDKKGKEDRWLRVKKSTTEEQNIMSNWCGTGVSQVNQIRRLVPRLTWEYDETSVSFYVHDICYYTVGLKRRTKKIITNPRVPSKHPVKKLVKRVASILAKIW